MTTENISKYIKLRPRQPDAPSNILPPDTGDSSVTPTLTSSVFSTNEVSGEVHIGSIWRIATDAAMTSIVYDSGFVSDLLSHDVPPSAGLIGSTIYYWTVAHVGARGGEGIPSTATSFETFIPLNEVFSIVNITGNGGTQNVVTGLDMLNIKGIGFNRNLSIADSTKTFNTTIGVNRARELMPITASFGVDANGLTSYNVDGHSVGSSADWNGSGNLISQITMLKNKGFCDIVTFSGDGSDPRMLPHDLETDVGFMMAFQITSSDRVYYWFDGMAKNEVFDTVFAKSINADVWGDTLPTSTDIYVGDPTINKLTKDYAIMVLPKDSPIGVKVGSYIGDGISGLEVLTPFQAGIVFIKSEGSVAPCITDSVSGVANGMNLATGDTSPVQYLNSISSDRFELSANSQVNTNGVTYRYFIIQDPNI